MSSHPVEHFATEAKEPTLAALLHSIVLTELPERFYAVIQLAGPLAYQLARNGWWHSAAAAAAISAFGVWGLCDHRLLLDEITGWRRMTLRVGRWSSGLLTVGLTAGLVLQQFLRLIGPAPIS